MIRDDYEEIGASIGRLIQEKQEAYGDSFNRANEILRVLYPDGVSPDKYRDFLAVTRVIDKLFRIATDRDAYGESPWKDIAGYSLLSIAHPEESEENFKFTPPSCPTHVDIKLDLEHQPLALVSDHVVIQTAADPLVDPYNKPDVDEVNFSSVRNSEIDEYTGTRGV